MGTKYLCFCCSCLSEFLTEILKEDALRGKIQSAEYLEERSMVPGKPRDKRSQAQQDPGLETNSTSQNLPMGFVRSAMTSAILASPPGAPGLTWNQRLKQRQSKHIHPPPSAAQLLDWHFCSQFGCISISLYSFYQIICSFFFVLFSQTKSV